MQDPSVVAVDLGGTKISTAVVTGAGAVSARRKEPVRAGTPEETTAQIVALVRETMAGASVAAVGMIVPGIYWKNTGEAWAPNLWGHRNVPVRDELQRQLGVPFYIDNDRAGYVLGEQWLGIARGIEEVVFIAVGTGIGAGIVTGGQVLSGAGGIAGAVGWFALNPEFQDVYAQVGCFEAEAAGPGLARRVGARSAEEVVAAARRGEHDALAAVQKTTEYLAMGVANLVSLLNPEMVVLGGGLMQASDLFLPGIRDGFRRWAQPIAAERVRIEASTLGEDAGLFGAARIALDGE